MRGIIICHLLLNKGFGLAAIQSNEGHGEWERGLEERMKWEEKNREIP